MSKHDCPHGLDLRKHPRCYLCEPVPRLLDLGGLPKTGGTFTVRCTCPTSRGDNYHGACPVHDVHVTYTTITETGNLLT